MPAWRHESSIRPGSAPVPELPSCGAGMRLSQGRAGRGWVGTRCGSAGKPRAERARASPRSPDCRCRQAEIEALAAQLKKRCGSGGTVRNGVIEIQGDHRDAIVAALVKLGWPAKKSGG